MGGRALRRTQPHEEEPRGVRATVLQGSLERGLAAGERYPGDGGGYGDPLTAARTWLAHADVFLAWVADHPSLVGIRSPSCGEKASVPGGTGLLDVGRRGV